MDTKMLEAFAKLYEKRSLRQAAEQLYVSPQGLSRLLQNLEGELDVMLFTRTPRGMEPTAAGEHLYRQADVLLRQHRQLAQDIQRIGGRGTDLSFVCSYGVLNALPYALLQEFQAENPSFTIKWREFPDRQAEQLLLDDRYELGLFVLGRDGFGDGYAVTELFSRRIVLLAYEGHPLYDARSVRFDQLRNAPIIMGAATSGSLTSFGSGASRTASVPTSSRRRATSASATSCAAWGRDWASPWISLRISFRSPTCA